MLGVSFDSVADQKKFAEDEGFPYRLLSDPDKAMGAAHDACRVEGEKYFEAGIPRPCVAVTCTSVKYRLCRGWI